MQPLQVSIRGSFLDILHLKNGGAHMGIYTKEYCLFRQKRIIHDHVDYIDRYSESEDLSELLDYLVIRIVPKEKELKIDFRGFGCKTYEDRFRSLAQEKNAMRYLDDYSDEQAMTLSELEILRRLSTFRHLYKAYPGHKIICSKETKASKTL